MTDAPMACATISALLLENCGERNIALTPRSLASEMMFARSAALGSLPSVSMATSTRP
ncbi:MAG TPA: hypothetical protein PK442_13005 [Synergistales bacterium]|nr:hypothetical protein [Synergistales bacterium]